MWPALKRESTGLAALTTAPATDPPALGGFFDARQTAGRLQVLHNEYIERLNRLISAVVGAQDATAAITQDYRTVEALNSANPIEIGDSLRRAGEPLDGGRRDA